MMKKRAMALLTAAMTFMLIPATAFAAEEVAINETNFPDAAFRSYVSETFDKDSNGVLSSSEIQVAYRVDVDDKGITDLKGVEYLKNVHTIICYKNELTSLDVSKNTELIDLQCGNNNISSLDVSKNKKLWRFICNNNNLSSLDVSKNTALEHLSCDHNNLTVLDVSKNTALRKLFCGSNDLGSLDVSKNTKLESLACNAIGLGSLDISKNTKLELLYCDENNLTSLDVSKNKALIYLYCQNNDLATLDLSKNAALKVFYCYDNDLVTLDVSNNKALEELLCQNNKLINLNMSNNAALDHLECNNNQLTNLDLSNTSLVGIFGDNNKYAIKPAADGTFNLSLLPGSFDVNKASNWVGGTVSTSSLIYPTSLEGGMHVNAFATLTVDDGAKVVTYDYDCGNDIVRNFQLTILPYKVTDIFTDVEDTWYVPYIQYVYDKGLMVGVDETTFAPSRPLTRAMFVQILYAQAGRPEVNTSSPFVDLTADWYKDAVNWAYANNIVSGKTETTFCPDDNITREQLAVMLYAYAGKPEVVADELDFPDAGYISDYAVTAITWAVQNGIMSGKDVNGVRYLEPNGQATRAEAATMVMQYLENYASDKMGGLVIVG